jgi:hypothetical protein
MKKIFAMAAVAALCLALGISIGVGKREGITLVFENSES